MRFGSKSIFCTAMFLGVKEVLCGTARPTLVWVDRTAGIESDILDYKAVVEHDKNIKVNPDVSKVISIGYFDFSGSDKETILTEEMAENQIEIINECIRRGVFTIICVHGASKNVIEGLEAVMTQIGYWNLVKLKENGEDVLDHVFCYDSRELAHKELINVRIEEDRYFKDFERYGDDMIKKELIHELPKTGSGVVGVFRMCGTTKIVKILSVVSPEPHPKDLCVFEYVNNDFTGRRSYDFQNKRFKDLFIKKALRLLINTSQERGKDEADCISFIAGKLGISQHGIEESNVHYFITNDVSQQFLDNESLDTPAEDLSSLLYPHNFEISDPNFYYSPLSVFSNRKNRLFMYNTVNAECLYVLASNLEARDKGLKCSCYIPELPIGGIFSFDCKFLEDREAVAFDERKRLSEIDKQISKVKDAFIKSVKRKKLSKEEKQLLGLGAKTKASGSRSGLTSRDKDGLRTSTFECGAKAQFKESGCAASGEDARCLSQGQGSYARRKASGDIYDTVLSGNRLTLADDLKLILQVLERNGCYKSESGMWCREDGTPVNMHGDISTLDFDNEEEMDALRWAARAFNDYSSL